MTAKFKADLSNRNAGSSGGARQLRMWRIFALILAAYIVGQDALRVLRFSLLDPNAGTFATSFEPAPQFAPGFVEITRLFPGGPGAIAGLTPGDHVRFDDDIRSDVLPMTGDVRQFTLVRQGERTRGQIAAVRAEARFIDPALAARSLITACANLIAALLGAFIIWRGRYNGLTLLLGVSLVAYSLSNSSPWMIGHSAMLLKALNTFGRLIQSLSPVAFVAFALQFYKENVGPVRRIAWQLLAAYAAVMLLVLAISEYLETTITVLPLVGDAIVPYTLLRLSGSLAALICVAVGWRRCRSEVQERYALLFTALFILVAARVLYLAHYYLLLGNDRRYSMVETSLAVAGTTLSAPLFAYAILKHKVLDLGFAINRTLIYAVISFGLVLVFGLVEWGSEQYLPHDKLRASAALSAGAALAITIVFHPVKEFVEHTIERLLFRSWHDNDARLRQFVHRASFIGKQDALAAASVAAISQFAGGADCAIYLASGDGYARLKGSLPGLGRRIDGDEAAVVAMRAKLVPLEPEVAHSALPAALALPMSHRAELDGFFLLAAKPSGEGYRPDEIVLLGWAAEQLGLDLHALKIAQLEKGIARLEMQVEELQRLLAQKAGPP